MTGNKPSKPRPGLIIFALIAALCFCREIRAQALFPLEGESWQPPVLGRDFLPSSVFDGSASQNYPVSRVPRVRLFGMPSGFLKEPVGLDSSDDPLTTDPFDPHGLIGAGSDNGPFLVVMGMDNPYFDYRGKNDPGGVGYYKLYSQVQLFDQGKSCLSLALQAVTPAGMEMGGLGEGQTVLSPTLAWFQEVGDGAALQGFIAKNIRARAGWTDDLDSGFIYGMAFQYALPTLCGCNRQSIHLFVEALGRYRFDGENAPGKPMFLEVFPGIHWRMGDTWWLSVGAARKSIVTCSWQF
jgi:hypothetical protein